HHRAAGVAIGIRQRVEVRNERTELSRDHSVACVAVGDSDDAAPVPASAEEIDHLHDRHLTFEARDTVEFGNNLKCVLVAETREVPAHREMAGDTVVAQVADERGKTIDVELKDEREANQDGVERLGGFEDLLALLLEIKHLDSITAFAQGGGEIAEAEIGLLLETD